MAVQRRLDLALLEKYVIGACFEISRLKPQRLSLPSDFGSRCEPTAIPAVMPLTPRPVVNPIKFFFYKVSQSWHFNTTVEEGQT